jgi:hypothetical protein
MSKTIMKKNVSVGSGTFQAELTKQSNFLFELSISELKTSTKKMEVKETEKVTVREEKIRPYNNGDLTASAVEKLQQKIDTYLVKHSVPDALKEVAKETEFPRAIETELKIQVERWIDEKSELREVPVMKEVQETKEKLIEKIPFYFRPSGGQVAKSIQNFIKHNKL